MGRVPRIWIASLLAPALSLGADTSRPRTCFDPASLRLTAKIEYDAVHAVAFSPDGRTLAVSTGDAGPEVDTLAVSPDGRWLVTATADGALRVYGR